MPQGTIREAGPADIAAMAAVQAESWREGFRGLIPGELVDGVDAAEFEAAWARNLGQPGRVNLLCERGGGLAGFLSFGPSRDADADASRTAEICGLYVRPGDWGAGVARSLWAEAALRLRGAGFVDATLWVLPGNDRAIRFYTAAGFRLDAGGRKDILYKGHHLPHVRYRSGL